MDPLSSRCRGGGDEERRSNIQMSMKFEVYILIY